MHFRKGVTKMSEMPPLEDVSEKKGMVLKAGEESDTILETTEGARGQQRGLMPQVPPPKLKRLRM